MARKVINRRVRYEAEYAESKREGHAFFPFAMFHDVVVNLMVVLVIVAMAIVWHATSGPITAQHPDGVNGWLGPLYQAKADPAVQQTEPRPEWYFLFLFELLRVFKEPWQLIFATIIIPTILMVLLIAWPIAGGEAPGAAAGSAITGNPKFDSLPAAGYISDAGCTTCHNFGGGGGNIGPSLANGAFGGNADQIKHQIENGGGVMPAFKGKIPPDQIDAITQFIVGLSTGTPPSQ
jgi:menaquinol-cytochrome c reductase cytochrome b/c subunit